MLKTKYVLGPKGEKIAVTAEHAPLATRNSVRTPRVVKLSKDSRPSQLHEIHKQRAAYKRMLEKNLKLLQAIRYPWSPDSIRFCRDLIDENVRHRSSIVALDLRAEDFQDIPVRTQYRGRVRDTLHSRDVITEAEIEQTKAEIVASAEAGEMPPEKLDLGLEVD